MTWLHALWKAALIVVALGVALMHSTGHACTEDLCHSETASITLTTEPHAATHDDGGHHHQPFGSGMSPMQVCMAILSAIALAVSLWAVARLARLIANGNWAMRARRLIADPPFSLPPGGRLSFMELSVFRI